MRITPAKALILAALSLVFVVEGRTVLAFFGVRVEPLTAGLAAVLIIGLLAVWALWSARTRPADQ